MEQVFRVILNISYTGGLVILALLLLRVLLKKAPKWLPYLLWSVAFFRLLCPFSFESALALLPSVEPLPQEFLTAQTPQIHTGIGVLNSAVNPAIAKSMAPAGFSSINPAQILLWVLGWVWVFGVLCMLVYALWSTLRFSHRIRFATLLEPGIYESDQIDTAFVFGLFRPKIYIPTGLNAQARAHVLLHERTHIRRRDYIWKPLSFLVLALHWFNPLIYAFYLCFDRDMELSCDERVLKDAKVDIRQSYSATLLAVSAARGMFAAPLAFGESNTKLRIRSILQYRKPVFWVAVAGVILAAAAAVVLLLNPISSLLPVNAITEVPISESERTALEGRPQSQTPCRYAYRVDTSIKSMQVYVEGWRKGVYRGTWGDSIFPVTKRAGTLTLSESVVFENQRMSRLDWTILDANGAGLGYSAELPDDFQATANASSFLYYGAEQGIWPITINEPVILGAVGFSSGNSISSYDCQYLMENTEVIAKYDYVYLFRCVFSTKSIEELEAERNSLPPSPGALAASPSPTQPMDLTSALPSYLPDVSLEPSIVLIEDGNMVRTVFISGNDALESLADTVIWNHMVLSAAWPAVDVDDFENRIELNARIADEGEITTFYIFVKDGRPCLQPSRTGMWTYMLEDLYNQLYAAASGEPITAPAT